ncbi:MAG: hypothetical protein WA842_00260 [Croceibacterium sp.]
MHKLAALFAAAAALASVATVASAKGPTTAERNEARLATMLDGRTAGEPRHCISAMDSNKLEVIEYVGMVYDAGDTIYVARAHNPRMLGSSETPIVQRTGSTLCTSDVTRTFDQHSGMTGVVFLDDFVPYTKQG